MGKVVVSDRGVDNRGVEQHCVEEFFLDLRAYSDESRFGYEVAVVESYGVLLCRVEDVFVDLVAHLTRQREEAAEMV